MVQHTLEHMHLHCADLEPMIAFWQEAMGATVICRRKYGEANGAVLDIGAAVPLSLKEVPCSREAAMPACIEHLGFLVEDMEAARAQFLSHPGTRPDGDAFRSGDYLCAFFAGPEGVRVEFMQKIIA